MRTMLSSLTGLVLALSIVACSGGGGGGAAEPSVTIQFPPPVSEMSDVWVTVSGTTEGGSAIASVSVNGVEATSSDGFANWRALVPLSVGVNELNAEVQTIGGGVASSSSVTVVRQGAQEIAATAFTGETGQFLFDPVQRRLLGFASASDPSELLSIDVASGYRTLLAGSHGQSGYGVVSLGSVFGATFDPVRHDVLVAAEVSVGTSVQHPVVRVDPDYGFLETIASGVEAIALTHDPVRDRLLLLDHTSRSILAVDLDTLARTTVSGPTVGSGPDLLPLLPGSHPRLVVDAAHDRILFLNLDEGATATTLLSINPQTGHRSQVALNDAAGVLRGAAWNPVASELLLARDTSDPEAIDLLGFDPVNGSRRMIASSVPVGSFRSLSLAVDPVMNRVHLRGPRSLQAIDLGTAAISTTTSWAEVGGVVSGRSALDRLRNVVYTTDPGNGIKGYDASTGEEVFSWDSSLASVSTFPGRLLWDPVGSRILYRSYDDVHALDPQTQSFSVISSTAQAEGGGTPGYVPHLLVQGMDLSADGSRVWLAVNTTIVEIDVNTGVRTVIDDPQPGSATSWVPGEIAADEARGRLVCAVGSLVFATDLNSGTRTILSGEGVGSGPELGFVRSLIVEAATGQLLVSDWSAGGIVRIDPVTGGRLFVREGLGRADFAGFTRGGNLLLSSFLPDQPQSTYWRSGLGELQLETGCCAFVRSPLF